MFYCLLPTMIVYRTLHWWAVQLEWSEYLLTFAWTRGEQEGKVHWCWSRVQCPLKRLLLHAVFPCSHQPLLWFWLLSVPWGCYWPPLISECRVSIIFMGINVSTINHTGGGSGVCRTPRMTRQDRIEAPCNYSQSGGCVCDLFN